MPIKAEQAPSQGDSPWQPTQPPQFLMEEFQGLYTSTTRPGVKDEACWWIDGYIPLGRNDLRTLPGLGPAVFTGPTTGSISFFDFATKRSSVAIRIRMTEFNVPIGFSVSPDGKSVLYPLVDRSQTNLKLVENFK